MISDDVDDDDSVIVF